MAKKSKFGVKVDYVKVRIKRKGRHKKRLSKNDKRLGKGKRYRGQGRV